MSSPILTPGATTLRQLETIYWQDLPARIDPACKTAVDRAEQIILKAAAGDQPVYGVNTGFGKLASVKIAAEDRVKLQRNLILSHACGVGPATPPRVVRLMMILKMLSLSRGASGVRWGLIKLIEGMLEKGVTPVIPAQGSVGASGDLAPLAHMTCVMIGEGEAEFEGAVMNGAEALRKAGLEPLVLQVKEGVACINGTQFSTAYALAGLFEAWRHAEASLVSSSLSTDAIMGSTAPTRPEIHELRGHRGQIETAAAIRQLMEGSEIRESHLENDSRVQDPYCIRCQPQVTGACIDLLRQAGHTLEIEANAVTDNPLILDEDSIVSGGNFHAEPVAFAADQIAIAIAEIGAISQRRIALMVDPALNFELPTFLTPRPGLNSGYMIAEVTTAALMSENKHLANPCSTDSTPTSANQEDHVSMAAHGARRLERMNENLANIIAVEVLCATQGIEFRAPLRTSPKLQNVISRIRSDIPALEDDRYIANDLKDAAELIRSRRLISESGLEPFIHLGEA
ncbi:MAG: histidine ammonia-lyase [Rhizobiaceae bacterium MnEN-MB40S]|nr:MAG: histidine ammonia-lyase [Rhizobiaceae bacterium MnEN-MB40S]